METFGSEQKGTGAETYTMATSKWVLFCFVCRTLLVPSVMINISYDKYKKTLRDKSSGLDSSLYFANNMILVPSLTDMSSITLLFAEIILIL